jgi:hypothetical protein
MSAKKLNKRESVAEWYMSNVYPDIYDKDAEIEWLVQNLKDNVFEVIERMYNEQMNNLEAEGFFK